MNHSGKIGFIFLVLFLHSFCVFSEEGMWLPHLLKQLNEADMQAKGMKMTAEDIYSVNKGSLKDAVISFGGFCTGEIISNQGLILTNHHCGFRQIQYHSSVEKDYITHGFWAMTPNEELPCPGLTATFIVRIENVTDKILEGILGTTSEEVRQANIQKKIAEVGAEAIKNTHYDYVIRPFFYGNEYYMFITETFKDVRMVGAPPSSIGNFGKDSDNWMWPRHTGDFSLFRIYANAENKPAEYATTNVPFTPRHFFPINMETLKEGDFTMVFGFPGRTQQYLTSYAVKQLKENINPTRIEIRKIILDKWSENMRLSDEVRIKYAAKYAGKSNYYKKWQGENNGLVRLNTLVKKIEMENAFANKVAGNKELEKLLPDLKEHYLAIEKHTLAREVYSEAILSGIELLTLSNVFVQYLQLGPKADIQKLKSYIEKHFKDFDLKTDKKVALPLLNLYSKWNKDFLPTALKQKKIELLVNELYTQSAFTSKEKTLKLLSHIEKGNTSKIKKDPAYILAFEMANIYQNNIQPVCNQNEYKIELLSRKYIKALIENLPDYRKYYPDANGTLRVSYGIIDGYEPRDAVQYLPFTTFDGMMEKYIPNNEEFDLPPKMLELYQHKDYGPYADNGQLIICFAASNHTTGGNSGSPIINAKGHLIGLNFDRSWESTMSDIAYDATICRNIGVNIKYVLFVIDKFAGAGYLINEMKLVKEN
ncbi:MAG: S46 family peptidase [Bacteroidetes bacterium]|nr:S46 family peptidase [Bacteroidota bacterium]MBV6461634.1 Asp/Glu-specific dipeptidyl-peptidase [Flavobacteriales bacterium]WKZ74112.1 MAG: S46 family peptidase [Vicingaceae bacterium]MCL4816785.1 S46 family peptidase [Flavobacteriales bacterium]NOG95723.1 S46 family peptidase [Bacteroidota bacterium]